MATYYNQKLVHINKGTYGSNYLMVGNDEIAYASTILKYGTFKVYLSLAGNVDGLDIGLSRAHITKKYDISERTYKYAVKELSELGYLVQRDGELYDFFVTPYGKTLEELGGGATHCTRYGQHIAPDMGNTLHQGSATDCTTNSSYISDNNNNNNNLAGSETNADATNNTNEETEAKSSASKKKNGNPYDKVDETEFVNSLSIEDYRKVADKVKPDSWIDFKSLHTWFHDNYKVHISDFEALRNALSRRRIDIENQKRLKAESGRELHSLSQDEAANVILSVIGEDSNKIRFTKYGVPKIDDVLVEGEIRECLRDVMGVRERDIESEDEDCVRFVVLRAYGMA